MGTNRVRAHNVLGKSSVMKSDTGCNHYTPIKNTTKRVIKMAQVGKLLQPNLLT